MLQIKLFKIQSCALLRERVEVFCIAKKYFISTFCHFMISRSMKSTILGHLQSLIGTENTSSKYT